tara:strand:+ start:2808 stop:3302 length:495 start_codon:yes stop_codon:yes gene_type:complete
MSFWTLETKADIGICGYANTLENLFREMSLGMINLVISQQQANEINAITRHTAQWNVKIETTFDDFESLMLSWLEEVLYQLEVKEKFLVDAQFMLSRQESCILCNAQVSFVNANEVTRNLEIKAVTSHEFMIRELRPREIFRAKDSMIPELAGPAWVGQVIFDI